MKRRSGRKEQRKAARRGKEQRNGTRRGSALGSIITLPFVALVTIIKLPFGVLAFIAPAIGPILMAIIRFFFAAVGAAWGALAAILRALLRIPFGAIGKMLLWGISLVWNIVSSIIIKLFRVLSHPRGLALFALLLIIALAAAYPENSLRIALVAVVLSAGAYWLLKLPGSIRVARNPQFGNSHIRVPLALNTRGLDEIYALTPRAFEEFVRDFLSDMGYRNLSVVGGAGDLGVDIMGQDPSGRSCVVQCKRYLPTIRVNSPKVQHFLVMKNFHHKAERGLIVTTSGFTQPAVELARAHEIVLIDGKEIVRLLHRRPGSLTG